MNQEQVERIAAEFARRLREALTKREMSEVRKRNRAESNPNVCHSHDFCDANVYMAEAFAHVLGRECLLPCDTEQDTEVALQADCDIMNAAWALAKQRAFASTNSAAAQGGGQ